MKRLSGKQFRAVRLRGLQRMTAGMVHHRAPTFSPDGRWLCMQVGEGAHSAWLLCDNKGRPALVLPGPAEGGASFAPDGSLAYGRRVGATLQIWQLDSGGKGPHLLLGGDGRCYRDPAYSPDGQWLCYAADGPDGGHDQGHGGDGRLYLLRLADGTRTRLPAPAGVKLGRPSWSPAGDGLYCEGSRGEEVAVYLTGPFGEEGTWRRLTAEGVRCRRPAPVLPGLLLVEREHEDGSSDLLLLDHDGDKEVRDRRLTEREDGAREPAVVIRKGEVQVACAMLSVPEDGDVSRYDLFLGRLSGLSAAVALPLALPLAAEPGPKSEEDGR